MDKSFPYTRGIQVRERVVCWVCLGIQVSGVYCLLTKKGLWVMAAKFEFETMKNASSARALLQQGIRANPDSKLLWTEVFLVEMCVSSPALHGWRVWRVAYSQVVWISLCSLRIITSGGMQFTYS